VKLASLDALDLIKSKTGRICPLICEHGYKADGDRCTKVTCRTGYEVGDDNTCEKIEVKKLPAKRHLPQLSQPRPLRLPDKSYAVMAAAARSARDAS
jgi:hypothetical protein